MKRTRNSPPPTPPHPQDLRVCPIKRVSDPIKEFIMSTVCMCILRVTIEGTHTNTTYTVVLLLADNP